MLGDINKNLVPIKYEITLHKPDRTLIAYLSEALEITYETNFGGIDELNFKLPYYIDKDQTKIKNPNWDLILGDYLVCLNSEQYFMIIQPESTGEGTDFMQLQCFSLEYELSKKIIRSYKGTVKIYDLVTPDNGILNYISTLTSWSIGHIDTNILLKYRTFDISEQSILETMTEIQEKYNCIITYDTINKTINIYEVMNIGMNKGLVISEENYIKTIGKQILHDEIVTRLYVYGKDDMSIRGYNPTGTNYIEDFSFFKETKYMSQELITALDNYEILIQNNKLNFDGLLAQLDTKQDSLIVLQNELFNLETELKAIQDSIDVNISAGIDYADLSSAKTSKKSEISSKKAQISTVESDIDDILADIDALNYLLSKSNNFTSQQLIELDYFIREKTWQDSDISDEEELYNEAVIQLQRINQPPIQFEIDIIDFLKVVECQHDWDKLKKGDIINVTYDKFDTDIEVRLIGMVHNEDSNELKLKFSNKNKIDDPYQYFKDIINMAVSTSSTLDMSKYKWDKSEDNETELMKLINDDLDTARNKVLSGKDQNIVIDEYGIHLTDINNDMEQIRMINNVIAFTKNGWQNASLAITPNGIVAEQLFGTLIAGVNLLIQNSDNTFTVDGQGVTLSGGALKIIKGSNGIELDALTGLTITKSDNRARVKLNSTDGFLMQTGDGTGENWTNSLFVDLEGNANFKGIVDAKDVLIGGQSILDGVKIKGGVIQGKGFFVTNDLGQTTLLIDSNGNITLGGNITWLTKPSYTAGEVGAIPEGWLPTPSEINAVYNSQTAVFNTITNNGDLVGLFMAKNPNNPLDTKDYLYINADYIYGDTITGKMLRTSNTTDYVHIKNQWIDFYTADIDTGISLNKLKIGFTGVNKLPQIWMGAGDGTGGNLFFITKGSDYGELRFDNSNGTSNGITFSNNGYIVFKGKIDFTQADEVIPDGVIGTAKFA